MNSNENQELRRTRPPPHRQAPLSLARLKQPLYLLSILVLVLGVLFSVPKTNLYKLHHLRSTHSCRSNILHKLLRFLLPVGNNNVPKPSGVAPTSSPYCVLWMAPFLTGGGYSSEAWSYILALHEYLNKHNPRFRLCIDQHGDLENPTFWEGLSPEMRNLAIELYQTQCKLSETIVVCHSEPGAWNPPLFQTIPCPPSGYHQFKAVIGRTMFETDRVSVRHVKRCNKMDFVWVPTEFHSQTFVQSGVDPLKVVKIVQPVDWEFFDPRKYKPLDLTSGRNLVLGSETLRKQFVFLSIFKWEYRKGWDVLLRSYLKEFSAIDAVGLYMLTNPYHTEGDFGKKMVEYVENSGLEKPVDGWAPVYVFDYHIPQVDLPRLYKAANVFVLPSRGEGWGRPIVEAMAMALPVIATNWSGPTEYLTEENSYPLEVDRMSEVEEGPFKGHFWAEPSVQKLQVLMRHVMANVNEAKAKGKKAREDMVAKFSPSVVAQIVAENIQKAIDSMG